MKKLNDPEQQVSNGEVKTIAESIAVTIGKEVVCAEKPAAEAFLKKVQASIEAAPFSIKKEVELFAIKQAISLFADLTTVCGCPDAAQAAQ